MEKKSIFKVDYDEEEDMLFIHSSKGKSKESVEIEEDIILDVDKNNNLVGIEFMYASEFFKVLNKKLNKAFLSKLKQVKISMKDYRNFIFVMLEFEFGDIIIEERIRLQVKQYESPLIASIAN